MAAISDKVSTPLQNGDGTNKAFAFDFSIIAAGDIGVYVDGVEKDYPDHYGVVFGDTSGTVTFHEAPAEGTRILLVSQPDYSQTSAFADQGAYNLSTVNTINRRATIRNLVTEDKASRALKVPLGEAPPEMSSLSDADGRVLGMVGGKIVPIENTTAAVASDVAAAAAAKERTGLDVIETAANRAATADDREATAVDRAASKQALSDAKNVVQQVSDALTVGTVSDLVGTRIYTSQAGLLADLVPADDLYALVVGDPTPANNDLYRKNGATGGGSWDGPLGIFAAASAKVQAVPAAIDIVAIPATPSGIWPSIQDADNRILEGVYPNGLAFSPGGAQASDITALKARAAALEGSSPNFPLSPGGIIPSVQDADYRILEGFYVNGAKFDPAAPSVTLYQSIFPHDARLLVSDYIEISEQSAARLRFHRPIVEFNNFQWCAPGARVGFYTNARLVQFRVGWTNLVTRNDPMATGSPASVLADGIEVASIARTVAYNVAGTDLITVNLGSSTLRKIELVWPYFTGMDLLEVLVSAGAALAVAPPRPATIMATCGDSITHGAYASKEINSWTFKLAAAKNWQLKNFANGSRTAVGADGTVLAGCGATRATLMIGYNDWANNIALSAYQASVLTELQAMRAALPSAKIYAITPIYSTNTGANTNGDTLADFRAAMSAAFTAWADGNSTLIDGLLLMTNNASRLGDGSVHPNDLGSSEIATALAAIIS